MKVVVGLGEVGGMNLIKVCCMIFPNKQYYEVRNGGDGDTEGFCNMNVKCNRVVEIFS